MMKVKNVSEAAKIRPESPAQKAFACQRDRLFRGEMCVRKRYVSFFCDTGAGRCEYDPD